LKPLGYMGAIKEHSHVLTIISPGQKAIEVHCRSLESVRKILYFLLSPGGTACL
jgi:hypothetical protein